ncbi:AMP-binding protein [Celerinatantimonas sp. YJH-8]|uniref:AMP-binding protein n=1 Tax=Celerinatantimonas sp. YJH-8 TaxID=3228714 RepID=UPI0038C2B64A
MCLLITRLAAHAMNRGDYPAVICEQQGQLISVSYSQLYQRVLDQVAYLQEQAPHCIALRSENNLDWVVTDLAAMVAGIPIVPIPMFFSNNQIRHILAQSGCDLLIGDWDSEVTEDYHPSAESQEQWLPGTAKLTFTSGSSGMPKGVCLSATHLDEVCMQLASVIEHQTTVTKHLVMLPLSTLLENITGIYVPLWLGKTTVVLSGESVGLIGSSQLDPARFAQALQQHQPHSLVLTPAILQLLLHLVAKQPQLAYSLDFVAVGGARVSAKLIDQARYLGIPVYEGYGLSECGSVVTLNTPLHHKAGTSGQVLSHLQVRVNEQRELEVCGPKALGYLGQPFTEPWLATGDLAQIDAQGFITILGRRKNILITSFGRNISPEWIESEAQIYPELSRMIVVGEGQPHLSAWVCHADPGRVQDAIAELNTNLPDYAQIKEIGVLNQWPVQEGWFTANGRPVRHRIPAVGQQPCQHLHQLLADHLMIGSTTPFYEETLR